MNKATLIAKVAQAKGLSKKETEDIFNAFIDTIVDTVNNGEKVQIVGFGTFEVAERAERVGRNPQTGENMTISASKAPKFKAGKALKDAVNA